MCGLKMLFLLLLLSCWIIAGIMALDPPTMHYRAKNSSLCLQIRKSESHKVTQWIFNETQVIFTDLNIIPHYKDKVDYNPTNLTLCVKRLTMADSGTYEVVLLDSKTYQQSKQTHKLIVQDAVPRPVIRMSVKNSNLSAGVCNISVNCSVHHDWAQAICDDDGCRSSRRSVGGFNISIFAHNGSVFCSGSNYVSTSNVSESMEMLCFNKSNFGHEHTPQPIIIIVITAIAIAVIILVCASLCALIAFMYKKHFSTEHNQHQTFPDQLPEPQPRVPRVSTSSEVSYENVDASRPGQTSSPTTGPRMELASIQSQHVDTVYSFVQEPNSVAKSDGDSKDGGHVRTQEASQSVALCEAQQHVDTLYCLLQNPHGKNQPLHHH